METAVGGCLAKRIGNHGNPRARRRHAYRSGVFGQMQAFLVARIKYIATHMSALREVSRKRVKSHAAGLPTASATPVLRGVRH